MHRIRSFMIGRSGLDQLSLALILLGGLGSLLFRALHLPISWLPYWLGLGIALYRTLSRNLDKRRGENLKFLQAVHKARGALQLRLRMLREWRTHRYLRCPRCRQLLRVPKGKGKIEIRCSRCASTLVKKV